jgi:hypothetical protein
VLQFVFFRAGWSFMGSRTQPLAQAFLLWAVSISEVAHAVQCGSTYIGAGLNFCSQMNDKLLSKGGKRSSNR